MAYQEIVSVDISINDVNLTQRGFGTPLFITSHSNFDERVREYNSLTEVGTDFATTEPAYRAAQRVFGQSPSVQTMKIGRRKQNISITLPEGDPADGLTYSVDVRAGTFGDISTDTLTYGPTSSDTVTTTLQGLLDAITGSAVETYISGVLNLGTTLVISLDTGYDILELTNTVGAFEPVTFTAAANETAADVYQAIRETDSDFYFIGADDNTAGFATALAASIAADDVLYFVGSRDLDNVATVVEPDNSLFGQLQNNLKVVLYFHQDATGSREDSTYPEMGYLGYNAPFDAGSVTWANLRVANMQTSRNYLTGKSLTTTQKSNLNLRNANYMETDSGITYARTGRTSSGEWIDVVRGVAWQKVEISTAVKGLLLNQQGGKVTYDDTGIARVREVISSALQRGVNRGFLSSYTLTLPFVRDLTGAQRSSRILDGVKFTGVLAGAIHVVGIQGSVTSDLAAA